MQLITITSGGTRMAINPEHIVKIVWSNPDKYMEGGVATMIDGSTVNLDKTAMIKFMASHSVSHPDFGMYER